MSAVSPSGVTASGTVYSSVSSSSIVESTYVPVRDPAITTYTIMTGDASSSSSLNSSSAGFPATEAVNTIVTSISYPEGTTSSSRFLHSSIYNIPSGISTGPPAIQPSSDSDSTTKASIPAGAIAAIVILASLVILLAAWILMQAYKNSKRNKSNNDHAGQPFSRKPWTSMEEKKLVVPGSGAYNQIHEDDTPTPTPSIRTRPLSAFSSVPRTSESTSGARSQSASWSSARRSTASSVSASTLLSMFFKTATVRYRFVPTRPDELPLHVGEMVRVVASFDDGWALVESSSDDSESQEGDGTKTRGMAPLGCLDIIDGLDPSSTSISEESSGTEDRRTSVVQTLSTRASSLSVILRDSAHSASVRKRTARTTQPTPSSDEHSLMFSDHSHGSSTTATTGDLIYFSANQYTPRPAGFDRRKTEGSANSFVSSTKDPFAD